MADIKRKKLELLEDSLKRLDQIEKYINNISKTKIPHDKNLSESSLSMQNKLQIESLNTYKEFAEAVGAIIQETKNDITKEISSIESEQSNIAYQQTEGIKESMEKFWVNPFERIQNKTKDFRKSRLDSTDFDDLNQMFVILNQMNDTTDILIKTATELEQSTGIFQRVERPPFYRKYLYNIQSCLCCCCNSTYRTDYESI